MHEWDARPANTGAKPKDPARFDDLYRAQLEAETRHLEVRGFHIHDGRAVKPLPIEEIYTPLHHQGDRGGELLESVLRYRAVLIQGDPGSGKTMFLRRVAFELARKGDPLLEMPHRGFPLLLRISDLDQHVHECLARHTSDAPTQKDDPRWLAHALASPMNAPPCEFFEAKLKDKETVVLLDGLDEAQSEDRRDVVAAIIRRAAKQLPCRFVVTSRPSLRQDNEPGFTRVTIADLEPSSRTHFLMRWSQVLYSNDPSAATRNRDNLEAALATRPDVEEMARSPLMLTAIAVIYWNDKRLPDHRAALYSAVVNWLAVVRVRPGVNTDEYLRRFSTLAFAMQADPAGRQVSVDLTKAARDLRPVPFKEAKRFLQAEEAESGMIVSRGGGIAFKHLTFQEYLAACHLDGLMDFIPETAAQPSRIYRPEWREVMCLLAGRLSQPRAQHLVDAMIAQCGNDLEARARCVDLLSAMIGERPGFDAGDGYRELARSMLALFEDTEENRKIPAKVRAVAAEALGAFGTKRLRKPSDPDYWVALDPPAEFHLRPFRIGRFPVTVFEYKDFVDSGYSAPPQWKRQLELPSRPVVNVSWHDAWAYAEAMRCRLPTSDEWEFAAGGRERREYPWGAPEPDGTRANYIGTGVGDPTAVGLFPRGNTPEGIADLAGNVWEWTSRDYQVRYKESRGGSFLDYDRALRCSDGGGFVPGGGRSRGIRCAR